MAFAMSRSVSESKSMVVIASMTVRAEDVAGDQEALLDLLVGPFEARSSCSMMQSPS